MQNLPVYLYSNLFEVILDLDNNRGIHQIMYQRPIKVQKGVKNTIQIQFKNSDQKKISINGQQFYLNVFDQENRKLVLKKPITVLDNASTTTTVLKGLAEVVLDSKDTITIDTKTYNFSIVKEEADGSYSPAYANTYYDVAGILELKEEVYPKLLPSVNIVDFIRTYNQDPSKQQWEWYSGNIRPLNQSAAGLHTVAKYMTRFKGQVIIEATLENSPGFFGNYAVIDQKTYNDFTGVDYVNFTGLFTNVRIKYIPAKDPTTQQNGNTTYSGTFDKALYRC